MANIIAFTVNGLYSIACFFYTLQYKLHFRLHGAKYGKKLKVYPLSSITLGKKAKFEAGDNFSFKGNLSIEGSFAAGKNCSINAIIKSDGNFELGNDCEIAPEAYSTSYYDVRGKLKIGNRTKIKDNKWTLVAEGAELIVGNNCYIWASYTDAAKKVSIGNNCIISAEAYLADNPSLSPLPKKRRLFEPGPPKPGTFAVNTASELRIEDDCWLGMKVSIIKGITLGKGTIVGTGAVVTKSFPSYSVIAGNPARLLKKLKKPAKK